jgi:hypothetical protein
MSADTAPRKSPCANTGRDSLRNLKPTLPSNPALSIPPIDPARVFRGWLREAVRLARLAASTGRAIHAKALQRHLEAMSFHAGAMREELP